MRNIKRYVLRTIIIRNKVLYIMYFGKHTIIRVLWVILGMLCAHIACDFVFPKKRVIRLPPMFVTSPPLPVCKDGLTPFRMRIPSYENAWQTVEHCAYYTGDETAWVMTIFYDEWVHRFGDTGGVVDSALANLEIVWSSESRVEKNIYGLDGTFYEESEVHGLFNTSPVGLWIYAPQGVVISDTSLIHELVHMALFVTNSDADADHEGGIYPGWTSQHTLLIDVVKAQLYEYHDL